jgi:hypothetical protein
MSVSSLNDLARFDPTNVHCRVLMNVTVMLCLTNFHVYIYSVLPIVGFERKNVYKSRSCYDVFYFRRKLLYIFHFKICIVLQDLSILYISQLLMFCTIRKRDPAAEPYSEPV